MMVQLDDRDGNSTNWADSANEPLLPAELSREVPTDGAASGSASPDGSSETERQLKEATPCFLYLLTLLSAIGGFLFGYDTGVVSGAMILLRDDFDLTPLLQEVFVSITIASAAVFALIGGWVNNEVGRKPTILLGSVVFAIGALLLAAAVNIAMLLCGRCILGIGIGLASTTVPMYIAESAPADHRGQLVTLNNIFITGGQFVASIVDGIFSYDSKNGWRYMFGLAAVPSVIQFIGFFFMPESPRWLASRGRYEQARAALHGVQGPVAAENELEAMTHQLSQTELETSAADGGPILWRILWTPHVRRALLVGCALQLFQQICGINTVMYYSATIIKMAGVRSGSMAIWLAVIPAAVNFMFTFVGLYLVERLGRRKLTLASLVGSMVSLAILAVGFQLMALKSPPVTVHEYTTNRTDYCDSHSSCGSCTHDADCGYCFVDTGQWPTNGSCLPVAHGQHGSILNNGSSTGRCEGASLPSGLEWAYGYCPTNVAWIVSLGLVTYLIFFAPGMGPMPWTINSEIYPLWARSTGTSVTTMVNWLSNLVISMTFLTLTNTLTIYGTFWLYAGFALLGTIVIAVFLPETKGKSLEQVAELFRLPWYSPPMTITRCGARVGINAYIPTDRGYVNELSSRGKCGVAECVTEKAEMALE
ncbi:Proton myo-inositol cotransporter [Lamellibrachia satsuma]|nr:Proton myo-inositol cotransporter [Lamellibrachia satsuma]